MANYNLTITFSFVRLSMLITTVQHRFHSIPLPHCQVENQGFAHTASYDSKAYSIFMLFCAVSSYSIYNFVLRSFITALRGITI